MEKEATLRHHRHPTNLVEVLVVEDFFVVAEELPFVVEVADLEVADFVVEVADFVVAVDDVDLVVDDDVVGDDDVVRPVNVRISPLVAFMRYDPETAAPHKLTK
eukprot:Phypoly_transcript_21669.p2 GENE.Phypoly_transcript_21669~~Phypoly_transcript_21669.p2  ORF type:complete len:104 (+),score=27.82 Phypoly_transcript_21669:290-601(+)